MVSTVKHDWPMVPFSESVDDVTRGLKKVPKSAYEEVGATPIVDQSMDFICGYTDKIPTLVSPPYIVFGDHTRELKYIDFAFVPGADGVKVLKPAEGIDSKFLYYHLKAHPVQDLGYSRHFKLLKELTIPLPPLDEQRRIAKILDNVRDSLYAVQQQVQLLLQLPSLLLGELFKFSEKRRLDEIAMVGTGATPSRKNAAFYQGDIPWVKTTEVKGTIILETEEKISVDALESSTCKLNRAGSSVVAMYGQGATRGRVGYLGIEAATNQACAVVAPRDPKDDYFVYQCLLNSYEELRGLGRGGTQPNLNLSLVRGFQIPYPPAELRAKISKDLRSIENVIRNLRKRRELLNELFESLTTRAFQGEL